VIVDLEDAVAPADKDAARGNLGSLLGAALERTVCLRVNGLATPWGQDDLEAAAGLVGVDTVVLPKVESPGELAEVAGILGRLGRPLALRCLIESARGVEALLAIASAEHVAGISLGEADLRGELRCDEDGLDFVRSRLVVAAAACGLPRPPQSVYPHLRDAEGLARSCARGRSLGFLGRSAIHPGQLAEIERAYLPTDAELAAARDVIGGDGAARATEDGAFVDAAFGRAARETVALAARYGTRG
jgi:citrate lyase subunit beta/citryl-CoA lyase